MSIFGIRDSGQKIAQSNLIVNLDASQLISYPGTGTTWTDISGNQNSGSLLNGAAYNSANGGSIVFDGTDDRVQLPSGFSNWTAGITLDSWIRPGFTNANFNRVFELGNGIRTNNVAVYFVGTNYTGFFLQFPENTNNTVEFGASTSWVANTWYNYCYVANVTRGYVYRNGLQIADNAFAYLPSNTTRSANFIGTTSNSFREHWQGNISVIRMYNRALSASEVLQNFNASRIRFNT